MKEMHFLVTWKFLNIWSYSSEFFWVVPSESTPVNKNMHKVNGK